MIYAIQGILGSFHHIALEKYLKKKTSQIGEKNIIPCLSFPQLAHLVGTASKNEVFLGLMAIENSSVGSLLYNYNLIQQYHLKILGEVYISIEQCLLANKGVRLDDIKEVRSHPIALQQCITFLGQKKWKLVETEDTAVSAKKLAEKPSHSAACVAGKLAAEIYGLDILASQINDHKKNSTRFLMVSKYDNASPILEDKLDKASIQFHVKNEKGLLAKVLLEMDKHNINLSKLQSFAVPGTHFMYNFHADMEFDDITSFHKVIPKIKLLTEKLTIHGIYKKAI